MLFNNENEPDLGPVDWGGGKNSEYDSNWEVSSGIVKHNTPPFVFNSEEELVASEFFQRALSKALAFKDANIRSLQKELMNYA